MKIMLFVGLMFLFLNNTVFAGGPSKSERVPEDHPDIRGQLTIQKKLPLGQMAPAKYFLRVEVTEKYKYPKEVCSEIHGAIGLFLGIADQAWKQKGNFQKMNKKKSGEQGTKWSEVAANYATIYQVVCK